MNVDCMGLSESMRVGKNCFWACYELPQNQLDLLTASCELEVKALSS